ncbi:hypothetical protein C8R46DRAFT_1071862 [Mycena filopes]|nr:hypothetical protein C8R46DRAFT_1071862 [Mycena filopes]
MDSNSQPEPSSNSQPEPSFSSSSTRAVLDFLRVGAALDAARAPRMAKREEPPSVEALAARGIKVRDFAYESKLPPIRPYRPVPKPVVNAVAGPSSAPSGSQPQSQPNNRRLKRTRRDGTEEADLGYGFVMGVARVAPEDGGAPPRKVQRMTTPELGSQSQSQGRQPRRENALLNIEEEYDVFGSQSQSQSQSQGEAPSSYSQEYSQEYFEVNSQGTAGIVTPSVTPNGSLQWIGGEGPGPRNPSPPLVPTEPVSLQGSTSAVRPPPPESPTPTTSRRASPLPPPPATPPKAAPPATAPLARVHNDLLTRTLSSISTLSSPPSSAPSAGPSTSSTSTVLPRTPTPAPPPSPPPRYELRKRTAVASPVRTPKRRGRPAPRREDSLAVVIQS